MADAVVAGLGAIGQALSQSTDGLNELVSPRALRKPTHKEKETPPAQTPKTESQPHGRYWRVDPSVVVVMRLLVALAPR